MLMWLVAQGGHELVFLTQRKNAPEISGVRTVRYAPHHVAGKNAYGLVKNWENAAGTGFAAAMAVRELRDQGFVPDIIIGHVGWGEMTFLREVLPDVPQIGFFEYYYSVNGGPVGFDPAEPVSEHSPFIMASNNIVPTMNIHSVDVGHSPMYWQRDRFPKSFHDKIYVCHDGIRTDRLVADPNATINLGRAGQVKAGDEIVTYMARNLETTRGFHQFMRSLPHLQKARPGARIIVIGGNEASYGKASTHKGGLRGQMEAEVGHLLDWERLHFVGRVPYSDFMRIVQVSRCHIYLSMPFVLSWSMIEAMSMEALVVASDVAPVREVITHGQNGLLVDFFDPEAIAAQVAEVLERPGDFADMRKAARSTAVGAYDFLTVCLPEHIRQINALVPEDKRMAVP